MSYSFADDSIGTDGTNATSIATEATFQTVTAVAPEKDESSVNVGQTWLDVFWACMLDDHIDKDVKVFKSFRGKIRQLGSPEAREGMDADFRDTNSWTHRSEAEENMVRSGSLVFSTEKENREYMEFRKWKNLRKQPSRSSFYLSDEDEIAHEVGHDSKYRGSRQKDSRRGSTGQHRPIFDDDCVGSFDSTLDPIVTYLSSETCDSSHGYRKNEHKQHSMLVDSSRARRDKHSQSRNRSQETKGILKKQGKEEVSQRGNYDSKGRADDRRPSKRETGKPPKAPPKLRVKLRLQSKQNGIPQKEKRNSEECQNTEAAPRKTKRAQYLQRKNEINSRDSIHQTMNDSLDGAGMRDFKLLAPYTMVPLRRHFDIPSVKRANSFDGVLHETTSKASAPILTKTPDAKESKNQNNAAPNLTTSSQEQREENLSVISRASIIHTEYEEVANGRDELGSSRWNNSALSSDDREITTPISLFLRDDTSSEIPESDAQEPTRSVATYLPSKRGAIFHRKSPVSCNSFAQPTESLGAGKSAHALKYDRYCPKQMTSKVEAAPLHCARVDTMPGSVKEKTKFRAPGFFKVHCNEDSRSVFSTGALSLGRKSSRLGIRTISRKVEANSVFSSP